MKILKSSLMTLLAAVASFVSFDLAAQNNAQYGISDMALERSEKNINLTMKVNPAAYHLSINKRVELTPVLRSQTSDDVIEFPAITIAGRNAWYNLEREGKQTGNLLRSGKKNILNYAASSEWQDWMEYSTLELIDRTAGCCGVPTLPDVTIPVAAVDYRPAVYSPSFHYRVPTAETSKMRRIEGKAYVNFPVNKTEIYPDYMNNPQELRKITSTIDSVKFNPDATVKSITLIGFASPEGPYLNNVRLAKERTEAVKDYVKGQYTFPASIFHTNSVPEDWEGLRDSVAGGILPDRTEILKFIDNTAIPIEKKNDELKRLFPQSYAYLLKYIYPWLRHTNYAIDFEIRSYADVNEIRKVMNERPSNLSLNEFFIAANSYPVGSEEYDRAFELAAIYYPNSDVANLNAANSAMNEGDYKRARMLLNRVANSAEAEYAASVLEAFEGNYEEARKGAVKAAGEGISEADATLKELDRLIQKRNNVVFSEEFKN